MTQLSNTNKSDVEEAAEILKLVVAACYDLEQTKPKVEAVLDEALRKIVAFKTQAVAEAQIKGIMYCYGMGGVTPEQQDYMDKRLRELSQSEKEE